ncbi:MAG: hypothetical protein JXA44_05630 [Methanospirillaceae archaeon]|nr:hypothetical protein [Methanospirillaceae archaeon]
MSPLLLIIIAGWIVLCASAQVLIKYGIDMIVNTNLIQNIFSIDGLKLLIGNKIVVMSGILYIFSLFLCILAMTRANISFLSPFGGGLIFVLTAIIAAFFLEERVTLYGWLGITVTFLGILITIFAYNQPN